MIKVWLDDNPERDPGSSWNICRSPQEVISILCEQKVDILSLDHDLGLTEQDPYPREVTGMDVVDWMIQQEVFPRLIGLHSANTPARNRMYMKLFDYRGFSRNFYILRAPYYRKITQDLETTYALNSK